MHQIAPTTLDATAGKVILIAKKAYPSVVLELEGHNGRIWKDHSRNCALYRLPNVNGTMDPKLSVILRELCERAQGAAAMIQCNVCSTSWHIRRLTPPPDQVPTGRWNCPHCQGRSRGTLHLMGVITIDTTRLLGPTDIGCVHHPKRGFIFCTGGE